jgi:type I pantothenate kinase
VLDDPRYHELAHELRRRVAPGRPLLVGITGPVAVGKSTTAEILHGLLETQGLRADLLCTDCFLLPNSILVDRGLTMRKGFPETFDSDALASCLQRLRAGDLPVLVPVYSHAVYDIVPEARRPVGTADVVLVEGVNALQRPAVDLLDVSIYVDAEEGHVRHWFIRRFLDLCTTAETDDTSFYRMFAAMPDEQRLAVAAGAWDGINGPNLKEHILPSRDRATFVLRKGADHSVLDLEGPGTGSDEGPRMAGPKSV